MNTKKCAMCNIEKELSEFFEKESMCKECINNENNDYKIKNIRSLWCWDWSKKYK